MATHSKSYREALAKVDRFRDYQPAEAISLLSSLPGKKFNESVEVHIRTGLNVRHADEQLRGTIALPHGLGKDVTVVVFAQGDKAKQAEEAGADIVGTDDLAQRIQEASTTSTSSSPPRTSCRSSVASVASSVPPARCRTRRSAP